MAATRRYSGFVNAARALLTGIVDYAGTFPPAGLSLEDAARNYARYRTGPDSWMLGRFVLPCANAAEFQRVKAQFDPDYPWPVTCVVTGDTGDLPTDAPAFESVEVKAATVDEISRAAAAVRN